MGMISTTLRKNLQQSNAKVSAEWYGPDRAKVKNSIYHKKAEKVILYRKSSWVLSLMVLYHLI